MTDHDEQWSIDPFWPHEVWGQSNDSFSLVDELLGDPSSVRGSSSTTYLPGEDIAERNLSSPGSQPEGIPPDESPSSDDPTGEPVEEPIGELHNNVYRDMNNLLVRSKAQTSSLID